jgi:flavin reductase (DIM6/NTAB) family NADH-FMN oxidoreductase RutF
VTIHASHPFPTEDDPVRRLRGRLGGQVSLWTAGDDDHRSGLTVTSLMIAGGAPGRLLGLLDPDSDLRERLEETGRGVLAMLQWRHRQLAEQFAGTAPAPGGPFRAADFVQTEWGPRLTDAPTWAGIALESLTPVGWSVLATCTLDHIAIGEADEPLMHRRGRYSR